MKIIVNPHSLELQKTVDVNSGEYNIQKCEFEFSNEYNGLTKMAIFSNEDNSFQTIIIGNECIIPYEILQVEGTIGIGVFGYELDGENLVKRYSPKPVFFNVELGSYQYAQETEQPSQDIIDQILSQIASQGDDIIALQNNLDNLEDNVIPTLALKSEIPTKTSQLTNDSNFATLNDIPDVSNFITKDVDNLTNYTKTSSLSSVALSGAYSDLSGTPDLSLKQDTLVSGTNIKTINNESILGSGNINISGGGSSTDVQINGTSITSNDTANIITKGEYNPSSNKIATESDLPDTSSFITKSVNDLTNYTTTTDMNTALSGKQATIDSNNMLDADLVDDSNSTNKFVTASDKTTWSGKQDTLVSGTNIKTINNNSILGSGNIDISTYLGKTSLYKTQDIALDLNELKKGVYILKNDSNNNKLWLKATYKLNSSAEPTTQYLEIDLFDDINTLTGKVNSRVALNELLLYIDTAVTEDTIGTVGGINIGSLTTTISDKNRNLANNFKTIKINTTRMVIGSNTYENFNIIQTSTLPTASSENVGRIIQYTGTTNANYTKGYFYKCVSDGQSTPTYSWEQLDVQPSSGGSSAKYYSYDLSSISGNITDASENIKAIMNNIINDYNNGNIVFLSDLKNGTAIRTYIVAGYSNNLLTLSQTSPEYYISADNTNGYTKAALYTYNIIYWSLTGKIRRTNNTPTDDSKTFYFINPMQYVSNPFIATQGYQPATKKYVDVDHYSNISGYDATKTQVLKNVNGVIQWVDE